MRIMQIKQRDFRSFLLQEFNMSYNAYLSLLDSYKLQLIQDYNQWLVDGRVITEIGSYLKRDVDLNNKSSPFIKWLKKRSVLSYSEFLNLPLSDKVKIYNQYCSEVGNNVEK